MHGSGRPLLTPDFVRVGAVVYFITWKRLLATAAAVATFLVVLSSAIDLVSHRWGHRRGAELLHVAVPSSLPPGEPPRAGVAAPRLGAGKGKGRGEEGLPLWCPRAPSLYFLEKWKPAGLGSSSNNEWPSPEDAPAFCDWLEATTTAVPFRVCTFPREEDTQVSAHLHKEGLWNAWKTSLMQDALPVLESWETVRGSGPGGVQGRTVVLDIGSNVGFFTLLAATRGYDVISVEPARDSVIRQLFSLHGNGIAIASQADEPPPGDLPPEGLPPTGRGKVPPRLLPQRPPSGPVRLIRSPRVWAFANAAADAYTSVTLEWVASNPGASWVIPPGASSASGLPAVTVPLDDLLVKGARARDAGPPPPPSLAPALDPTRIRLIKVSAEAWDSRALAGMRQLLSKGRVPFLLFVFNSAHVQERGCDPAALVHSLTGSGYRIYHSGIWVSRPADVERFLKGVAQARSTELLFVHEGIEFS